MSQVGVTVSSAEGAALFRRFGYDAVMPYERFAHTLITQPARQLAEDMPGENYDHLYCFSVQQAHFAVGRLRYRLEMARSQSQVSRSSSIWQRA
jgi:NADPH:quinone reductase-like Zn-dependent oxidoreductase